MAQRQINVEITYISTLEFTGIYNVEQCRINIVHFNVDMNNVRQRRNNVIHFNNKFHKVGQCQNNVVKMTICRNNQKKSLQIEYSELKVLTAIS